MKRPARVPASTAVRMNSASNRIAKWYQKAIMVLPPTTLGEDVGHADRQGRCAAGARDDGVLADVAGGLRQHFRRDHEAHLADRGAADSAVVPSSAAGLFMAK